MARDYDRYPYGTHEESSEIYFGIENEDTRLPLKEITYGFDLDGVYIAYPASVLSSGTKLDDTVAGRVVQVIVEKDGTVTMVDTFTGQVFIPLHGMWFAWAAFHPDTLLYNRE